MTGIPDRRVALVANTSFYVGPHIAREMARRGHDLVVGDPEDGLVAELEGLGAAVEVVEQAWDLSEPATTERLVGAALDRFGRLDAATTYTGDIVVGRFLQSTAEDVARIPRPGAPTACPVPSASWV